MEDSSNAIEVRNLYKRFKIQYDKPMTLKERLVGLFKKNSMEYHDVLKNINIDIKKGETVALIGTNGSGKSTLLKLMTKILYPNQGTLEVNGKLTSLLELGAGFHPDFTGRENIYFNAAIFGLNKNEIEDRIEDIIEFSELREFIDNPVRTYSSGMYMRLAFSIAINVDAEILLIDEILAVGDQHFQDKCFNKLKELRDSNKTIVIVSHSLGTVKDLCTRAIWLYNGEFRLDGDPAYVIYEYLKQQKELIKEENINEEDLEIKSILFVESPRSYESLLLNNNKYVFEGWNLNVSEDNVLKILLDDKELNNVKRKKRNDVYITYKDLYVDADENTIGWIIELDNDAINAGKHKFEAIIYSKSGKELTKKEVTFSIE